MTGDTGGIERSRLQEEWSDYEIRDEDVGEGVYTRLDVSAVWPDHSAISVFADGSYSRWQPAEPPSAQELVEGLQEAEGADA